MKTPNTHTQTAFRLLVASILATTLFAVTPIATAEEPKKAIRRTEEKNIKDDIQERQDSEQRTTEKKGKSAKGAPSKNKSYGSSSSEVPKNSPVPKAKIEELKAKIEQTKIQIKELDLQIAKQENLKRSIPKSATTKSGYASEEGAQRAKQLEANIAAARDQRKAAKIMKASYEGGQAAIQTLKAN